MDAAVADVDLESLTAEVKDVGLANGATVVGVADPTAFNEHVPAGHRPEDLMPGVRSVIVAGALGPTSAAWQSPNRRLMEITGYDFRENVATIVMAEHIENVHGHKAMQAPTLPTSGQLPPMSMMLAAVLAGLGTRAIAANIILHPEYGLMYYAATLTTLALLPDHEMEEHVCPARSCTLSRHRRPCHEAGSHRPCPSPRCPEAGRARARRLLTG